MEDLSAASEIALDTETTSTDPMRARLVGISLAVREGEGYYIPVGHQGDEPQLPLQVVMEALRPIMEDPSRGIVGHNLKYDSLVLSQHGLNLARLQFDTMLAEWLIDPGSRHLGLKIWPTPT